MTVQQSPRYEALRLKHRSALYEGGEELTPEERDEHVAMNKQIHAYNDAARARYAELLTTFYGDDFDAENPTQLYLGTTPSIRLQLRYAAEHHEQAYQARKQGLSQEQVEQTVSARFLDKLPHGQAEMRRFTEFLKQRFFAGEPGMEV